MDNKKYTESDEAHFVSGEHDRRSLDPTTGAHSQKTGCYYTFVDLSNLIKSFIGSSYLSLPFGFYQAGIVLGCIILSIVVCLTAHCCLMIVNCKKYLLERMVESHELKTGTNDPEYRKHLANSLSYADIGRHALGKAGILIVDFFLVMTQLGFCVTYFIFIGNTIHSMFPFKNIPVFKNNTMNGNNDGISDSMNESVLLRRLLDTISNDSSSSLATTKSSLPVVLTNATTTIMNFTTTSYETTTSLQPPNITVLPPTIEPFIQISTAPNLIYLVLIPLLPCILFAYIRRIRKMGSVSFLANIAIFGGYAAILIIMIVEFKLAYVEMFNWAHCMVFFGQTVYAFEGIGLTFPVFFGQTVCAFEGIGLIIPVESSMEGNQHRFPMFLCIALGIVASVLMSFGIVGYLRYGSSIQQVIVGNLEFGAISIVIDGTLILAVLFTYPLQYFPVAQIMERYIFGIGKIISHHGDDDDDDEDDDSIADSNENDENEPMLARPSSSSSLNVITVAGWKRNILRTVIVLVMCALAILLRDNFAYISSFIGSFGSTSLAFILPCIFHLKIEWKDLSLFVKIKDIIIIAFGVIGGVVGIFVVIQEIIKNFNNNN